MSICDYDTVDGVQVSEAIGEVILTMFDGMEWDTDILRLRSIERKLTTYLEFISSGQLLNDFPAAAQKPVTIQIVDRCPLEENSPDFVKGLQKLGSRITCPGVTFRWATPISLVRYRDSGYKETPWTDLRVT